MTVSPMFRAAAARVLSDTSRGSNNSDAESNLIRPFVALGGAVAACLVLASFCGFAVWLRRRCGWTRQSGTELDSPPRGTEGERQQMQQEMEDERKLEATKQKRKARRRKYEQFLAPYTLTVVESDLYTASKSRRTMPSESTRSCSCVSKNGGDDDDATLHETDGSDDDDESFEDEAVETRPNLLKRASSLLSISISSRSNKPQERLLRHPFNKSGSTFADVDASCSICLLDYEKGDRVVFSTRSVCRHAFHEDCIMMWLEKGRKRCPMCRNFFVPNSTMDNKTAIQHDEDDVHAIRNIPGANKDQMNDDSTDIEKCLHHEETDVDT